MSYILDALRKADAQRQRTRLPGLHAQGPAPAAGTPAGSWWRSPLAWAAGSALVAIAVVVAWPTSQQPVVVPVPTTVPRQETAAPAPAPVVAAAPAPVQPAAPAPATVVAQATPSAASAIQPAPPPPLPERRGPVRATRSTPDRIADGHARESAAPAGDASAPSRAASPAAAPAPATTAAAPAASAARTPQAQPQAAATPVADATSAPPGAPKLAITGGVYSTNAAQRLLIVGGQVFNEGSEVAPGVVLEQVRPNQALLRFQGQRYTVRY